MVKITKELVRKKSEHNEQLISTLEELSLHQENIECIENLHNWCRDLKILLMQSNLISKIENLYKLKRLEYLNLAINNIERVENLEKLESLNKLDLTLNFIGELTSIESLCDNYNLRNIILTGNPCCDYPHYRNYVIATLPQLEMLDCKEITRTERLLAQKNLKMYRTGVVQEQAKYAMDRDKQKLRVQQQMADLESKMDNIDDDELRRKMFWDSKSEHCPEIRYKMAEYSKNGREKDKIEDQTSKRRELKLFAPCGRPYNVNQAKLPFYFQDENAEYTLQLDIYKHLDTSLVHADVHPNYIRVVIKGKVFQIFLIDEVKTSEATLQRSQTTGQLVINVPKLHYDEKLNVRIKNGDDNKDYSTKNGSNLKNIKLTGKICSDCDGLPNLI